VIRVLLVCGAALALTACSDDDPPPEEALRRSCDGDTLRYCRPYEYAIVRAGTVDPPEVMISDPAAMVRVTVSYDRCESAPGPHRIRIQALGEAAAPDGGSDTSVYMLDELRDDGTGGDTTAEDGELMIVKASFFDPPVPPSENLLLRFQPALNDCLGGVLEVPYRTGPRFTP
jgi:hypothetical protein